MRWMAFLVIGLLTVGLLSIPSGLAQENDYLIVPGQRVGRWELGKPLDAYGFGPPPRGWDGTAGGRPYYRGYTFAHAPRGPYLQAYTCLSDSLVFAVLIVRRLDVEQHPDREELKYRTPEGVSIGMDESEAVRILGRPDGTSEWTERHGQFEVLIRQLEYRGRGLFVRINRADLKVLALGAMREGGFQACRQAVLGGPAVAQTVPVTVSLPVPIPSDLRITLPASSVPSSRAAFSGVWVGKWDNVLDTALVVQEFTTLGVSGIYAWGTAASWRIDRPGWSRISGRFAGPDELHVQMGSILVVYQMRSDGRLDGVFGGQARTTLTKVFPK